MKRIAIPAVVLAIVGLAIWWFSPTQVLKRRTAAFIDTANVPSNMSDIGRGARGKNLSDYMADRVRVDSPEDLAEELGREFSRDRAAALYTVVARYCREISITDLIFESVTHDGDHAVVRFSADTIVDLPNRRPVDGIVTVESRWQKTEGDWLLESFEWSESPRRP